MAWQARGSPTGSRAGIEHQPERRARVVRRATHDEVVRRLAPGLSQPLQVRLEPARGDDHRARRARSVLVRRIASVAPRNVPPTTSSPTTSASYSDVDAQAPRGGVVGVHQRLAAAEKERVGARQVQRAAKRRLKAHAVPPHPRRALRRPADEQPRERLVGLAAVDPMQIGRGTRPPSRRPVSTAVGASCAQRRLRV